MSTRPSKKITQTDMYKFEIAKHMYLGQVYIEQTSVCHVVIRGNIHHKIYYFILEEILLLQLHKKETPSPPPDSASQPKRKKLTPERYLSSQPLGKKLCFSAVLSNLNFFRERLILNMSTKAVRLRSDICSSEFSTFLCCKSLMTI